MKFNFITAGQIIFGEGESLRLGEVSRNFGGKAMVVTGGNPARISQQLNSLADAEIPTTIFQITGEPTITIIREGVEKCRESGSDFVIGIGGGSVVDGGKAIAGLATNPGHPLKYLEVIGDGQPLKNPPLPYIAVPTTSGTGAEVTKNAVLKSEEQGVKVSLRHPLMLPRIAIVDPELTYSVPAEITAQTGLDAFTQVLEPFVSHLANPLTDGICREGIRRAAKSLFSVFKNGEDEEARRDISLVSLFGGLALANAKLGAVHGFAGPMGGMFPIPHGAVCGILLPHVSRMNIKALKEREPDNPALVRYGDIARIVTGVTYATADEGIVWLENLCSDLALPGLAHYGVGLDDFDAIITKSRRSSSMRGNPIELTDNELTTILERAL